MQKKKIENKRKIIQASNSIETKGFFLIEKRKHAYTHNFSNTIYNQEKSEKNKI